MKLLLIEEKRCAKVSDRGTGQLTYRLLKDEEGTEAFVAIVANESVGYFSREPVPLTRIHQCLHAAVKVGKTIPSLRLRQAFDGRSVNNGGFLAAILRHEGMLAPSPDNAFQHVLAGDVKEWRSALLTRPGYALPNKETPKAEASTEANPQEAPSKSGGKKKKKETSSATEASGAAAAEAGATSDVASTTEVAEVQETTSTIQEPGDAENPAAK